MKQIIEIEHVVKQYKGASVNAVDAIQLSVVAGEKLGVFGPNGAGKTSFISMLCGIIEPTQGSISYLLDGQKYSPKEALKSIGYVPQDFAFYPELTARQNLAFFGKMYGLSSEAIAENTNRLLEKLGLLHVMDQRVMTYSGGMKRRINLAIGILNDPKILFLDEPTVGVDVQSKHAIMHLLDELNQQGTTIIYTSHHLKEAEDFCQRMALIDHGRLIAIGSLEELSTQYKVSNLEELIIHLTGKELRD